MKRLRILGIACGLGMALSGCNLSPTSVNAGGHTLGSGHAKEAIRSSAVEGGGHTVGSGNRAVTVGEPSDTSATTTVASSAPAADTTAAVERGGHTFGSGN